MTNVHTLCALLALAVFALSGCSPPGSGGFRNSAAPIASTTRFDVDRFAGPWHVVARFAKAEDPAGTTPESLTFTPTASGFAVRHQWFNCNVFECVDLDETKRAKVTEAGRFEMSRRGGKAEHWVQWVDADYRVAAIGTPNGRFGWIMAKGTTSPRADLVKAASDILQWQGYDMTKLRKVSQ